MITGINHITLSVADVEVSFAFYADVLGMKPVAKWPRGAYLLAGDLWIALVIDEKAVLPPSDAYTHIALSVPPEHFKAMEERILRSGATIWQRNITEGDSVYFLDPNGHKLEVHASDLAARMRSAAAQPWDGLHIFGT
jgi:catechol 2,3-dioxygenase-like lactoylglutathione lyase family enzyme